MRMENKYNSIGNICHTSGGSPADRGQGIWKDYPGWDNEAKPPWMTRKLLPEFKVNII